MNVLIGCECSGVVRRAFQALGHNAYSCDLKPAEDNSPFHYEGDARKALTRRKWDLGIFHHDCTYLCNSSVGCLTHVRANPSPGVLYGEARWEAMREAAEFFKFLLNCDIPRIAVENPTMHGHALRIIGADANPPAIQPYQFGDDASKATCLWLRGLPALRIDPAQFIAPRAVCAACGAVGHGMRASDMFSDGCIECGVEASRIRPRWGNQTDSGQNKLTPSKTRAADRARTYPGIARAMAEQWGNPANDPSFY